MIPNHPEAETELHRAIAEGRSMTLPEITEALRRQMPDPEKVKVVFETFGRTMRTFNETGGGTRFAEQMARTMGFRLDQLGLRKKSGGPWKRSASRKYTR